MKVRLHNQGEDVETTWAEDLGPIEGRHAMRLVRLGNIPFLHAKPTYGDVIEVELHAADGIFEWDCGDVPFDTIGSRIYRDDGRWVVVVDYSPVNPAVDILASFREWDILAEQIDIVLEGPTTGRAYLAVPVSMTLDAVMAWLGSSPAGLRFHLVHPTDEA